MKPSQCRLPILTLRPLRILRVLCVERGTVFSKMIRFRSVQFLGCWFAASLALAQPVAMITDLEGGAASAGGAAREIAILSEIEADARVKLEAGARLVAVYFKSGDEFSFKGPALVAFGAERADALSGDKPRVRNALPGGKVTVSPGGRRAALQSAIVMRGGKAGSRIRLLSPNGTRVLEARPEFSWEGVEGANRYQFELMDEAGRTVFEAAVDGTAFGLPATVQLNEGLPYTWEVWARLADGRKYSNSGDFTVAPAGLRAEAEKLRPARDAPVAERVAYAAWLEQVELRDEARRYWKAIAAERRDDPRIRALAGD